MNCFQGKKYTGYLGLVAATNRAIDAGIPLVKPTFYANIDEAKLDEILKGENGIPCPLVKERVHCLRGDLICKQCSF